MNPAEQNKTESCEHLPERLRACSQCSASIKVTQAFTSAVAVNNLQAASWFCGHVKRCHALVLTHDEHDKDMQHQLRFLVSLKLNFLMHVGEIV